MEVGASAVDTRVEAHEGGHGDPREVSNGSACVPLGDAIGTTNILMHKNDKGDSSKCIIRHITTNM